MSEQPACLACYGWKGVKEAAQLFDLKRIGCQAFRCILNQGMLKVNPYGVTGLIGLLLASTRNSTRGNPAVKGKPFPKASSMKVSQRHQGEDAGKAKG